MLVIHGQQGSYIKILNEEFVDIKEVEVMDIDEEAFEKGK